MLKVGSLLVYKICGYLELIWNSDNSEVVYTLHTFDKDTQQWAFIEVAGVVKLSHAC